MEKATGAESVLDRIKPPRLEDAGLEDCALPPELIREAFQKAASAVRSLVLASDDEDDSGGRCVDDPWEGSSDALVGIEDGVNAPSEGCVVEKGGGLRELLGDEVCVGVSEEASKPDVVVAPGLPGSRPACVEGLQGLEVGEKSKGSLGNEDEGDVAEEGEDEKEKPTLVEGVV